eukprot:s1_g2269.t1
MRWIYGLVGVALVGGLSAYLYVQHQLNAPIFTEETRSQIRADVAAQNEEVFVRPAPRSAETPPANPLNNAYFGDLHTHSSLSFDSYISGNRISLDDAYRVAKGEPVESASGEIIQLSLPLDFAAVTDHAEGFGLFEACGEQGTTEEFGELCRRFDSPNASFFLDLRDAGSKRPPESLGGSTDAVKPPHRQSTWTHIVEVAERHNEPGQFTTFAAYEYSPPLPDRGKIHRNIIFRNNTVPVQAVSAFDALTEIDLWAMVSDDCQSPCDFISIPHNPNKSWGLAFAGRTIDGDLYTAEDWKTRDAFEPIVEMFQIKGNSECSPGFGATDEECGFEQFLPVCEPGQVTQCVHPTSMARDGLKLGLELEEELGFNPLDFGMIGSTDAHNSNPGDAEEYDFRGGSGLPSGNANLRLRGMRGGGEGLYRNPGGLAVVWAPENTRDALFDAMERKEVYATSGTRIRLRFFGGPAYEDGLLDADNRIELAYAQGVPMGGMLRPSDGEVPAFYVEALQDPLSAPLDRVQIIKGWIENGEAKESVFDVACSGGRSVDPDTGRCPSADVSVDLSNCAFETEQGAQTLKSVWRDPTYKPDQRAFYYARVVQNPTCRWSTYDALRLGETPPADLPSTTTEMAWSSPIWIGQQ